MATETFYDRLSDDQLVASARKLSQRFDAAWKVCMASHYSSGRHIDAKVQMDGAYEALAHLCSYAYSHRSWQVCEAVYAAANWAPITRENR